MKNLFKTCLLVFVLASAVFAAPITVVTFASGDGTATSNTGSVYTITPHPLWGTIPGASWVSAYAGTGYGGGVVLPNTGDWQSPTMAFYQQFILPGTINTGQLMVGADDTAMIWLNNQMVVAPNWVQDSVCAAGPIGCEPGEIATVDLTPYLIQGVNNLHIYGYQRGGDVSGLIYKMKSVSESPVPEPGTYAMMGAGLLSLAVLSRRRKS